MISKMRDRATTQLTLRPSAILNASITCQTSGLARNAAAASLASPELDVTTSSLSCRWLSDWPSADSIRPAKIGSRALHLPFVRDVPTGNERRYSPSAIGRSIGLSVMRTLDQMIDHLSIRPHLDLRGTPSPRNHTEHRSPSRASCSRYPRAKTAS